MADTANKVKFGLKNVHYAKATFDEENNVTYDTPVRIPGAVSLSLDPEGEPENFYADDIPYYVLNNNDGYTGSLEVALIPESFAQDILNDELDANGVLAENKDKEINHFALLFEFNGDQRKTRHVLYNCVCTRPSTEGNTEEDSKEVQTESLDLTCNALSNGYVKAKTSTSISDSVYEGWYDSVYEIWNAVTPGSVKTASVKATSSTKESSSK